MKNLGMGHGLQLNSIVGITILSVVLFTGVFSIPGFSSHSNEVIDDSIEDFTFGFVQLSSATFMINADIVPSGFTKTDVDTNANNFMNAGETINFSFTVPAEADAESAVGTYNGQGLTWFGVGAGPTFTDFTATYTVQPGDNLAAGSTASAAVTDSDGNESVMHFHQLWTLLLQHPPIQSMLHLAKILMALPLQLSTLP